MLELKQIEAYYPDNVHPFKRNMLREYIQYIILDIIYSMPYASRLIFMGGTAIRIVLGNNRFSEDLDFDNINLSKDEFKHLSESVRKRLIREGFQVDIRIVFKTAYHCYINIKNILYDYQRSGHHEEKLVIRVDTEPQNFKYIPEKIILNKFDIFTRIHVVPSDILLAQKLFAILNRSRAMGRDFFDAIYLFSKNAPNFGYLSHKAGIETMDELKSRLLEKCQKINLANLSKDIEPFIINPEDVKRVLLFEDYIRQL